MSDFFQDSIDMAKGSIDGVVNAEVNSFADNTINSGLGMVSDVGHGAAGFVGDAATSIGGDMFGGLVGGIAGDIVNEGVNYLADAIYSSDFMHSVRTFSLFGTISSGLYSAAWASTNEYDWRVRLSLPYAGGFHWSPILTPLKDTDNSMIWPFTPTVIVTNNANYNSLSPTHNNYSYPAYQNSSVDQITITGDFVVETTEDAAYWVAVNHYLRSITKMFYGTSTNLGAPPPVVKLNGYGDFVFNDVPVVIESFMINLPKEVDYIRAPVGMNGSWVPTMSEVSVTLRVAYSRSDVNRFSLDTFVRGGYLSSYSSGFI